VLSAIRCDEKRTPAREFKERRERAVNHSDSESDLEPRHLGMEFDSDSADDSVSEPADDPASDDGMCCNRRCCELGAEKSLALYQANYLLGWTDRRAFIKSRIKFKRTAPDRADRRVYYMDDPAAYTNQNGASLPAEMDWQSVDNDHIHICVKYFCNLYRVSTNFIYQPSVAGAEMSLERKQRDRAIDSKANIIKQWVVDLAKFYQVDPTSDDIFLPFYRKHVVWELFVEEQKVLHPLLSWCPKYFYSVWRIECQHVKVRAWLKFAKCDECIAIRKDRKATKQGSCLKAIRLRERAHIKFVKTERLSYYKRRRRGVDTPSQNMSIVIDGADQQAYALPYHHVQTHASQKAIRVPIHVYGVMVHGRMFIMTTSGRGLTSLLTSCTVPWRGSRTRVEPCPIPFTFNLTTLSSKIRVNISCHIWPGW
jgi:hypothetical protein